MATHFARGILTEGQLVSIRLSSSCHIEARNLPAHRRTRFLASRGLLAELMFMLYGISELPEIIIQAKGKPAFRDKICRVFYLLRRKYGWRGVDHRRRVRAGYGITAHLRGFHHPHSLERHPFSRNENLWVANQNDPNEARAQLITLRQSVLKLTGDVMNDDPRELQLYPWPDA